MSKILIPRRDHEVYFIPAPQKLKTKMTQAFVAEQLGKLHPGFTSASALDIRQIVLNGKHWIMATVMEAEILAEYKILHKGAVFFTNTSIAVHEKGFAENGLKTIDDELIGFDTEKDTPVSIPLECVNNDLENKPARLKNIPSKRGVYSKETPRWLTVAMPSVMVLLLLFPAIMVGTSKKKIEVPPVIVQPEPVAEPKYLPFATETLARFSSDVAQAGGKISRWQYNEDSEPFVVIQMHGLDALTLHHICGQYNYILLQDIQDVKYIDGEPHFTVSLNTVKPDYSIITAGTFGTQGFTLPIVAELTDDLRRQDVLIVSETLPTAGDIFYTVTYSARGKNLVSSLETINVYCGKYPLWVKKLDVSINSESNRFTVICSFSQTEIPNNTIPVLGNEKEKIPAAFGYREPAPPPVAMDTRVPEIKPEAPVVGSINDGSRRVIFYRDTDDGKMKIR